MIPKGIKGDKGEKGEGPPRGIIVMWSGQVANIPAGWILCDGRNGSPDLRNRFVVGAGGNYSPHNRGGVDSVVLSVNQMPSHNHSGSVHNGGAHSHAIRRFNGSGIGGGNHNNWVLYNDDAPRNDWAFRTRHEGNHGHGLSINSNGGNQPHENRPPFYALCLIMKT